MDRRNLEISKRTSSPLAGTARRRVTRNTIVINNSDRESAPTSIGLSGASCKANTIYHSFKRGARIARDRYSRKRANTWKRIHARQNQKSGRCASGARVDKTRSKLTWRDLTLFVYLRARTWIYRKARPRLEGATLREISKIHE